MNRRMGRAMLVPVFLLCLTGVSFAQLDMKWKGSGGWGPGSNYSLLFDPKTMETVTGEVVSLDNLVPVEGMFKGLSVIVQTQDMRRVPVHVGPLWYLEFQDVQLKRGDKVVVTGSKVTFGGEPVIIASEILVNGRMLRLRDRTGHPVWSALQPPR